MNMVIDGALAVALREQCQMLGLFAGIPSPAMIEMAAFAGFDFVVIDNEHGPASIETTEHLIRAARSAGIVPIVRVSRADPAEILRSLDIGASGIQVPQINEAAQARLVVTAAKYPPAGNRGAAFSTRAAGWGFQGGAAHLERSNAQTLVITHIETVDAVRNLDEMLSVSGVDVLFIGPTDLSVSMGYPGRPDHPEVQQTIADCIRRITAAGKTAGLMLTAPQQWTRFVDLGARYLTFNVAALVGGAMRETVAATKGSP
ncbi:MAG: 2,4-dihydroxyhept-2-ene-1,7-dioic acid aldolase [uncultured Chloroflexia bacterium]|uniref:2,4-dihydroxyhept-2-ene-1,7-dioic acid aldolase n=1 Tax=uncultured Chloroflexia bacterium TaxID=1672391 RepID=A0A6J4JPA3_9CHLR|nr:MAG: 2,4-dihydroxyhept-2-ene-1,7-dioic acid aldolase [uncultured Chloroflexia bacterium]